MFLRTLALCVIAFPSVALADSWSSTKDIMDDVIYAEPEHRTFYCGCDYTSHEDSDGSGDIDDLAACGYVGNTTSIFARRIEWEHIVPVSLMPFERWACRSEPNGNLRRCLREVPEARAMIYDLHNLAPSVGQVNQDRSNDRYADLPDDTSDFGSCAVEDTTALFEPPDCHKGDVARIWLYMHDTYGVSIRDAEWAMFSEWSEMDPVSPWEVERDARIFALTGTRNPYVFPVEGDHAGLCEWEEVFYANNE